MVDATRMTKTVNVPPTTNAFKVLTSLKGRHVSTGHANFNAYNDRGAIEATRVA